MVNKITRKVDQMVNSSRPNGKLFLSTKCKLFVVPNFHSEPSNHELIRPGFLTIEGFAPSVDFGFSSSCLTTDPYPLLPLDPWTPGGLHCNPALSVPKPSLHSSFGECPGSFTHETSKARPLCCGQKIAVPSIFQPWTRSLSGMPKVEVKHLGAWHIAFTPSPLRKSASDSMRVKIRCVSRKEPPYANVGPAWPPGTFCGSCPCSFRGIRVSGPLSCPCSFRGIRVAGPRSCPCSFRSIRVAGPLSCT